MMKAIITPKILIDTATAVNAVEAVLSTAAT